MRRYILKIILNWWDDESFDFLKKDNLVECEHSKLLGFRDSMVEKTRRYKTFRGYPFSGSYTDDKKVYFSPAFAPKWDIEDTTDEKKTRYFKKVEAKEIEIINH